MAIASINPATGALVRSFEALTAEAILQKIDRADEAFRAYRQVPLEHRAMWMRKLAAQLEQEADDLAQVMTLEMGKPLDAARQEALKCATCCRYYADHAAEMLTPIAIATELSQSYVCWEPMGVVLAVMPWNFPFWQVFRFLVPALMAGNAGLLKHAPNVPQCALAIESLVRRAGFPRGIFQALLIEVEQTEVVISDERVKAVSLTGSEAAGSAVASLAGRLIKKSVLELGGSDPFIVMASADLDHAVEIAVRARCVNNGQSCIAAKRFIIADSIYEEFEQRFVAGMEAMRVGDPMRDDIDVGPLASARILERLEQQVSEAIEAGARILTGGVRMVGDGFYFEPTVLVDLPRSCAVYREEFFGPVALLFRVADMDEAIALANDTPFGLGASVWTQEQAEQQRFVAELQAGSVFVNVMVASDSRLPFGGTKHSGYGRELSAAGMREFMHAKTVVVA
ncbi:NAD-dependent succinate-semialdehyde dehydrogenase [Granulicella arctica]|uniref:NAD-dependent succinate-semialdehyde dehydrogenase n=1 Tax=Granulicella arctica TaxID=940613 RepID=UPI0021E0813F|nr:NAD-dependent succinate-semialdehyde dehydrogenase [Granulicella arctica]